MIFASRIEKHRSPFGAVCAGTDVTFTLTPPRTLCWREAWLCVNDEFGGRYFEQKMPWLGLDGDADRYQTIISTASMLGPVWYWFRYDRANGSVGYLGLSEQGDYGDAALCDSDPPAWQLTVYAQDAEETPAWFGQGVTYHIFPDRFRRSSTPNPAGLPGDRRVHRRWNDCPDFLPDEMGEIRNRDFFGGDIQGVRRKLSYIRDLGVSAIYFSPVFEAASNHRYDTACYTRIDPMFGTEEEFSELCAEAKAMGIRVMLDGVFNHTGFDSEYFNGRGHYPGLGAYQSKESPYYEWYSFDDWPKSYSSWWGIYTLPQVNENNEPYRRFIMGGKDSVVRRWLRAGASGWRLDVADELPDDFIAELRKAAKEENPEAVIIGEVWEDASRKVSYGERRRYLLGHELDGVMNYPLRNALIGFMLGDDAAVLRREMEALREHYPRSAYYSLMNALGTHDTPRILTVLGAQEDDWKRSRTERALFALSPSRRALAIARLRAATAVLFALPGSPCVLYGDEAGLEGFEDPFNRRTYPWGHEDESLIAWYARLGNSRKQCRALREGDLRYLAARGGLLVFERYCEDTGESVFCCVNRGERGEEYVLPWTEGRATDLLTGQSLHHENDCLRVFLEPLGAKWIRRGGRK